MNEEQEQFKKQFEKFIGVPANKELMDKLAEHQDDLAFAMDRASIVNDFLHTLLEDNKVMRLMPEVRRIYVQAGSLLVDLYQACALTYFMSDTYKENREGRFADSTVNNLEQILEIDGLENLRQLTDEDFEMEPEDEEGEGDE